MPNYAEALNNLGVVLDRQGQADAALACLRRAVGLRPDCAEFHSHLGKTLAQTGNFEEAIAAYHRAIALNAEFAEAHFNLALSLLQRGDFANGWREYEWRFKRPATPEPPLPQPRWNGEPLAGRTLLVRCEQGLGDALQFIRYVELLHQRGARVIVECQAPLAELMARCQGVERVVVRGEPLGEFDVYRSLLSLPSVFETTLDTIPAQVPYLEPDPALVERWRTTFAGETALKVGIAWQGNPANRSDQYRSIPVAQFGRLAEVPGVRLYSLQAGAGREQLAAVAGAWPIVDLSDRLGDFHNTAAIVRNLDLVITCDSAPAAPGRRPGRAGVGRAGPSARLAMDARAIRHAVVSHDASVSPTARRRLAGGFPADRRGADAAAQTRGR